MSERLKGTVSYGRTIRGRTQYESYRLDWIMEFWLDEKTHEQAWDELRQRCEKKLQDAGLVVNA